MSMKWSEIIFVGVSGLFLFVNTLMINADDVAIYYADDMFASLLSTNYQNYRYLTVAFVSIANKVGLDYVNIIGPLCFALPVALLLCIRQLLQILALPAALLVPCVTAVLLHGLWADLHPFTMSYGSFTLALVFTALSLAAVRRIDTSVIIFAVLAVLSALAALLSYQPFLLVLPLGAALLGLKSVLSPDDRQATREAIRLGSLLVAVFCAACVLFFIVSVVTGSGSGHRPVSMANLPKNIGPYFMTLVDQVLSVDTRFGNILPLHERVAYGLMLPAAILLIAGMSWRRGNGVKLVLGAGAAFMGLLAAPGPFNLLGEVFWPSGRSTSPIAFFHVLGVALILLFGVKQAALAGYRWDARARYGVVIFIGLSVASHLTLLVEHLRQLRQDWAVGQSILAEMRRVAPLQDDQRVAFVGTWQNAAQLRRVLFLDYGTSAFTAPWSRVPFLRLLSGYRLAPASVPASACEGLRPPFEVRQHDGVLVVCMQ